MSYPTFGVGESSLQPKETAVKMERIDLFIPLFFYLTNGSEISQTSFTCVAKMVPTKTMEFRTLQYERILVVFI